MTENFATFSDLDINNPNPRKVKCIRNDRNSGYWGDDKHELTIGEIYDMERVEVYDWYSLVYIKGIDHPFNSVLFGEEECPKCGRNLV